LEQIIKFQRGNKTKARIRDKKRKKKEQMKPYNMTLFWE